MELLYKYTCLFIFFFFILLGFSSCSRSEPPIFGYIQGEYTYVASGSAGTLFTLFTERGHVVQAVDRVYQLDPEPEKSQVIAAQANMTDLESQLAFSKVQLDRQNNLYQKKATSSS